LNVAFYIARRYLFAKKSHNAINVISMISVCGIVVATIAMVCGLSVFNGFKGLTSMFFSVFDPELKIVSVEGKVFDPTTPVMEQVKTLSEIQYVCETLQEHALVQYHGRQDFAMLKGVEASFNSLVSIDSAIIDGHFLLSEGDFNYGVAGRGLAAALGINAGFAEPITIYMPERTGTINIANPLSSAMLQYVFLSGVFQLEQPMYDEEYMLVSIELMRSLLDYEKEVSALELKLAPGTDITAMKKKIAQLIGADFRVLDRYEQQEVSFRMMQIEKWVTFLILCFILMLALFNLLGSLAILMIEKEADITKLRTMGADNRLINRIFLFEGWMISLLGAVIGVVLGILFCLIQQHFGVISLGDTAGTFVVDAYPVAVEWTDVLIVFLTVAAIGFLSVLYPVHYIGKKRLRNGVVACLLLPFILAGCGGQKKEQADKSALATQKIAVSLEPVRFFAEKIAGDRFTFFAIVPAGQSPETFDPSPRDMIQVGNSIAYFHLGQLVFERTLTTAIEENQTEAKTFDLSSGVDFYVQDCDADHDHNHDHGDHDPHIWTSFKGARVISKNIFEALSVLDPAHQDTYLSNYQVWMSELEALEQALHQRLSALSGSSFVIFHPALTYFAVEFGLNQYSIEHEGKEPSAALLKSIVEKSKAERIKTVFVQMEFDRRLAEQIASEIGAKIVVINPLDYQWDEQIIKIADALTNDGKDN